VDKFSLRITDQNGRAVEFHGPADITQETTEAIVNAANSYLVGGGGVDGAIHRAGGPSILEECRQYVAQKGNLPAGQAMLTRGGRLAAKYVIHTVGPVYRGGEQGEEKLLASCYRAAVRLSEEHSIQSVAFPAISTGAYGYPIREAANIAVGTALDELANTTHLHHIRFVLFDVAAVKAYLAVAKELQNNRDMSLYQIEKGSS
jgi:O-acetyl-ADP-ribose deacetylase (regulator of RNase III)